MYKCMLEDAVQAGSRMGDKLFQAGRNRIHHCMSALASLLWYRRCFSAFVLVDRSIYQVAKKYSPCGDDFGGK